MTYIAVVEKAGNNYSAYLPDVPGCVSTGRTAAETIRNLRQALALHLDGMREDGMELPLPLTIAQQIEPECVAA